MCIELQESLLDDTQIIQILDVDEDVVVRATEFFVIALYVEVKLWRMTRPLDNNGTDLCPSR